MTAALNEGAQLLQRVTGSLAEVAAKLDPMPARQLVGTWRRGDALPSSDYRAALERAFGISSKAWDRRVTTAPKTPSVEPTPFAGSAVEELRRTLAQVTRKLAELEGDPDVSPAHFAQVVNAKANAAAKLARLTGEDELTISMICRSKAWRDILAALEPALAAHPAALAAVVAAMRGLDQ